MNLLQITLWFSIIILTSFLILAWFPPLRRRIENFTDGIPIGDSAFWARFMPRRGDVSIDPTEEEAGYRRDPRYFAGYTDIQRLGVQHDFCRTVVPVNGDDQDAFVACALAGTDGLSSISYRTHTVRQGLLRTRDDYMRDVNGDGRAEYCTIIPHSGKSAEIICYKAGESSFSKSTTIDNDPPEEFKILLTFYDGALVWLRMRDDLVDYAQAASISRAGKIETLEYIPKEDPTKGIQFNGADQFLRLGEEGSLEFGSKIPLRFMRAVSVWVYFDEFTNNAHIFDFGNGPGKDNVFLGIIGRGSASMSQDIKPLLCGDDSTIPEWPNDTTKTLKNTQYLSPQDAAVKQQGNSCPNPEIVGRKMPALQPMQPLTGESADIIYEVWDSKDRKMRITLPAAMQLKRWTHIAITALNTDALRPDIGVYINGELKHKEPSGHLPQSSTTAKNYIGKSNWMDNFSQYNNKDELFKGSLFDFRMYATPMTPDKIKDTVIWGKKQLNIVQ